MPDNEPSLFSVALTVARVEAKLDQALRQDEDHEARIRALEVSESSRSWLRLHAAPISAVGTLVSVTAAIFALILK